MTHRVHIDHLIIDASVLGGQRLESFQGELERELSRLVSSTQVSKRPVNIDVAAHDLAPGSSLGSQVAQSVGNVLNSPPSPRPARR
jgi:hypothetical protein